MTLFSYGRSGASGIIVIFVGKLGIFVFYSNFVPFKLKRIDLIGNFGSSTKRKLLTSKF